MGHPRKLKKKYSTPGHPFEKGRIEEENKLLNEYGLKNKKEVWKVKSKVRNFRAQARAIQADRTENRVRREQILMDNLKRIGLVKEGGLDEVLALDVKDLLERRLQTIAYRKGLARSIKQARQFITHGHIAINGRKVTVPGYIVKVEEEGQIGYYGKAPSIEEKKVAVSVTEVETKPKIPKAGGETQ